MVPALQIEIACSADGLPQVLATGGTFRDDSRMTHSALVDLAVQWLRSRYRCGIVLSEQSCASGEQPDVIGWKRRCRSVVVECKMSRADFLADRHKPFRVDAAMGMGSERFYMVPAGLIGSDE